MIRTTGQMERPSKVPMTANNFLLACLVGTNAVKYRKIAGNPLASTVSSYKSFVVSAS